MYLLGKIGDTVSPNMPRLVWTKTVKQSLKFLSYLAKGKLEVGLQISPSNSALGKLVTTLSLKYSL